MIKLVLLRHGESTWNKENRFTGWTDVGLSSKGIEEAKKAAQILKKEGFMFDIAYTSVLRRGIHTLWIVLEEMNLMWIPIYKSWRLNERHYGALQGLYKAKIAHQFGEDQVLIWRRSYDVPPPPLKTTDPRYPGNEAQYANLNINEIPLTECLKDTVNRFLPYWSDVIAPEVKNGKKIIISAHGNSLRALVKLLDEVPENEIVNLNIPTGVPLIYELDDDLKPIRHYYLGDPEEIEKAINSVADQGKVL